MTSATLKPNKDAFETAAKALKTALEKLLNNPACQANKGAVATDLVNAVSNQAVQLNAFWVTHQSEVANAVEDARVATFNNSVDPTSALSAYNSARAEQAAFTDDKTQVDNIYEDSLETGPLQLRFADLQKLTATGDKVSQINRNFTAGAWAQMSISGTRLQVVYAPDVTIQGSADGKSITVKALTPAKDAALKAITEAMKYYYDEAYVPAAGDIGSVRLAVENAKSVFVDQEKSVPIGGS